MKFRPFLLFLLLCLTACSTNETEFSIEGTAINIEGELILSVLDNNQTPTRIGKATIEDGAFRFVGVLAEPSIVTVSQFTMGRRNDLCDIFMDNSKVKLKLSKDQNGNMSKTIIGAKYSGEKIEFENAINKATTTEQKIEVITEFVSKHPKSPVSAYVLYMAYKAYLPTTKLHELSSMLKGDAKNSMYAKMAMEGASNLDKTAVGNKFTDFTLKNFSGKPVSLSSVAGKGDWVLLYFWDTYAQSMSLNTDMKEAENRYKSKGLKIFAVSLDDLESAWLNAVITLGDNEWIHVSDLTGRSCEVAKLYNITSIPTAVLIAPDGTIQTYFNINGIKNIKTNLSKYIE